jgi:hypothetical protein
MRSGAINPRFKSFKEAIFRNSFPSNYLGCVVTFLITCGIQSSFAASYYVDTAAQFNAKRDKNNISFSTLYAGDRVYLKGGNWDGLTNTITGSMTDANAQTNPAIIYACDTNYTPTVGGVLVTNLSSITLSGSGVVLAGLSFSPTSGMYAASTNNDYDGAGGSIITANTGSRYISISHIKFDYCGRDNTNTHNQHYGPWVFLYGYHNTLQYSEFTGRDFNTNDIKQTNPNLRTSIRDATVVIYKGSSDSVDFGHHEIRYNYFGQRLVPTNSDVNLYIPADGSSQSLMGNGWETIRLGNSSICNFNFATTIEYNSFYRSIYSAYGGANDANGEPEMLSIKSRGNTIRHNTFLNSYGQVCFREADYCIAEGNFFLGGGAYDTNGNIVFTDPLNYRMSGVRVIGYGHIVTGNYFYKLFGSGGLDALCLAEGTNSPGTLTNLSIYNGTVEYKTATYSQILGNSFIDCLSINLDCNLSTNQTNLPFATQFQNNLVYYSTGISGALGVTRDSNSYTISGYGGQASGNYIYTPSSYSSQLGSAASILGTNSNTITTNSASNPLITALFDVMQVPASNSPLLGGGFALPVIKDTSTQSGSYNLAGNVSAYGSIDNRGLPRPASGQEIGNYQGASYGTGTRPLRRNEVGNVASTYYPLLLPSTNASITISNLIQAYSGLPVTPSATTIPSDLPVTYTFNGSSNAPSAIGSYALRGAVYDPLYQSTSVVGTLSIVAAPTITGNLNLLGVVGSALSYQITASGNPMSFGASGLPNGLSLDTNSGLISGTPTQAASNSVIISAINAEGGVGSATLTINVSSTLSGLTNNFTSATNTAWICPANVTSIQIECWGGGGAGGSALETVASSTVQYGGGGAGGAYAKKSNYAVIPGTTYYINAGGGGIGATGTLTNNVKVPGGDSWFSDSNSASGIILAKGGAGGSCAVGNSGSTSYGAGGSGTANGSLGDIVFAGGSGATTTSTSYGYAGAGGTSGGTNANGNNGVANSGTGATAVTGGGNGGNPNATSGSSGPGQSPTLPPGGGGGGARSGSVSNKTGGNGATGQVILTVKALAPAMTPATITISNTNQIYNGMAEPVSYTVSPTNALPVVITYSNSLYLTSTNAPTNAGVFAVSANVVNSNFLGSNNAILTIFPITPVITISATNWPSNGSPRSVSTSVTPSGLPVTVTYAGSTSPPSAVGNYPLLAYTLADSNWNSSSSSGTLVIYDPVASWRSNYFGTVNNSGTAADNASPYGIGLNNLQAYTFGVNPTQPLTGPLLIISNGNNNSISLGFTALAAGSGPGYSGLTRYYNLEATTNLTNSNSWNPVPGYSNIPGSNQVISLSTNISKGIKWFYRLKAWLQ